MHRIIATGKWVFNNLLKLGFAVNVKPSLNLKRDQNQHFTGHCSHVWAFKAFL